ncbi:MAG: hypothetical protein Q9199_005011 [Rusavskia elegans]
MEKEGSDTDPTSTAIAFAASCKNTIRSSKKPTSSLQVRQELPTVPSHSIAEALHHCLSPVDPSKGRNSGRHHGSSRTGRFSASPESARTPHRSRGQDDKAHGSARNKDSAPAPESPANDASPRADYTPVFPLRPTDSETDNKATKQFNSDYDRLVHWDSHHTFPSPKLSAGHLQHLERSASAELQRIQSRILAYAPVFQRNLARERLTGFFTDATDLPPIRDLDWRTVLRFSASWCSLAKKQDSGDYEEVLWNACCLAVRLRVEDIEMDRKKRGGYYH